MVAYPVFFVNAFTGKYYQGNTAAVLLLDTYPPKARMQRLAKEFGFSETVFVVKESAELFRIRWFTPETEVKLCGHGTLAAATVLFAEGAVSGDRLTFLSRSGQLHISHHNATITMDFPRDEPMEIPLRQNLAAALTSIEPICSLYAPNTRNLIYVYTDAQTVVDMCPDFQRLAQLQDDRVFGIIVTAGQWNGYHYVCRYFAPWEGIWEDPVTGSAQVSLAPYWGKRLHKLTLKGYQASGRGGRFQVSLKRNRVLIKGRAFIYLKGQLARGF